MPWTDEEREAWQAWPLSRMKPSTQATEERAADVREGSVTLKDAFQQLAALHPHPSDSHYLSVGWRIMPYMGVYSRTVSYSLRDTFHNDVDVDLSLTRTLSTGMGRSDELRDTRSVNETDVRFNSGPETYPETVSLFFDLAAELLSSNEVGEMSSRREVICLEHLEEELGSVSSEEQQLSESLTKALGLGGE